MSSYIKTYLRQGNGNGQIIYLNPSDSTQFLYSLASKIFNLQTSQFALVLNGEFIKADKDLASQTILSSKDSIIHIVPYKIKDEENRELKIFLQGEIFNYETRKNSKIQEIKKYLLQQLKKIGDITLIYRGQILANDETLASINFVSGDILSGICLIPQNQLNSFKPKKTESITKSGTQNFSKQIDIALEECLRKSSMRSSHESRKSQNRFEDSGKAKSESELKCDEQEEQKKQFGQFLNLNEPWLLNKNCIETQSINCESEDEDDPQFWTSCDVTIVGENFYYRFDCDQKASWDKLLKRLSILLKRNIDRNNFDKLDWPMIDKFEKEETFLKLAKNEGHQIFPDLHLGSSVN